MHELCFTEIIQVVLDYREKSLTPFTSPTNLIPFGNTGYLRLKSLRHRLPDLKKKNSHVCYYTHMHGLIYFHTYGIIVQHTILYYTILYTILQVDG